jgi:signal transduction histidine kinase
VVAIGRRLDQMGVEAVLSFASGAIWFALCGLVLNVWLPNRLVVVCAAVALAVVVVLVVAHFWGIAYAVPVGVASVVAVDWYYIPPTHRSMLPDSQNAVALVAYLVTGVLLGELAVALRRRAAVSESARSALADEQAALRRVATLVAHQSVPTQVLAAIAEEVGRLLAVDLSMLLRQEIDGTATVVASWTWSGPGVDVGLRVGSEEAGLPAMVRGSGGFATIADVPGNGNPVPGLLTAVGVRAGAASAIVVDEALWGVLVAARTSGRLFPARVESQLGAFAELAATAVANAQTRAELTESRARLVASGDEARRRIERDLHDGVQQRLVSLALDVRLAQEVADREPDGLLPQLAHIGDGLAGVLEDLREVSHGIHPAVLSEGGLRPALATLARRSTVPVELEVHGRDRLPEPVEVGMYYVVCEALTNVAKHADASFVQVSLDTSEAGTRLRLLDDGVGGADPRRGSGLLGIRDRVHALGGRLDVTSPVGRGTSLEVTLPPAE